MSQMRELNIWNAYINCQNRCRKLSQNNETGYRNPFVTISRQTGAGGVTISEKLIALLKDRDPAATCPWTLFDKSLVHAVVEMHHLPGMLEEWMPEDRLSEFQNFLEELFEVKPSEWTLVHKTSETILHLASLGCAILVGRGANVVTRRLPSGFHVRLVGSLKKRIQHAQDYYRLTFREAEQFVIREDRGRKEYLKKHFGKDVDDPLLYHLVINTDLMGYDEAAQMIVEQVLFLRKKIKEGALT